MNRRRFAWIAPSSTTTPKVREDAGRPRRRLLCRLRSRRQIGRPSDQKCFRCGLEVRWAPGGHRDVWPAVTAEVTEPFFEAVLRSTGGGVAAELEHALGRNPGKGEDEPRSAPRAIRPRHARGARVGRGGRGGCTHHVPARCPWEVADGGHLPRIAMARPAPPVQRRRQRECRRFEVVTAGRDAHARHRNIDCISTPAMGTLL